MMPITPITVCEWCCEVEGNDGKMLRMSKIAELAAAVIKAIQITVGDGIKHSIDAGRNTPKLYPYKHMRVNSFKSPPTCFIPKYTKNGTIPK